MTCCLCHRQIPMKQGVKTHTVKFEQVEGHPAKPEKTAVWCSFCDKKRPVQVEAMKMEMLK